jgi:phospholipid/cholesterol/gamma-HCH transport system permease protein
MRGVSVNIRCRAPGSARGIGLGPAPDEGNLRFDLRRRGATRHPPEPHLSLMVPEQPTIAFADLPRRAASGLLGWVEALGLAAMTLSECLSLYLGILLGQGRLDLESLADALRRAGLSMLPAITLVAITIGSILGQQGANLIAELNLPGLVLFPFSYAVIMELTPILVGILVAGRAGVALAVRLATLIRSSEIDGLLVCGANPIHYATAPVLLAMLAMSFAFVVWASLVTFVTTFLWLFVLADIPPALFVESMRQTLGPGDLLEAMSKPLIFALVIALIATVTGIGAGRDASGAASAATRTMIGAVTSILLLDLAFVLTTGL